MINKTFKKATMLMLIVLGLLILLSTSVYASSNNARYVMDAELLSNNNIAVLFIKGGTSGGNALTEYGMLYYGIYNPDNNSWTERLVGGRAKEGALAIHDDKAHIAYVTDNDLIGYIYQTDTGWSDVDFIHSNDANGEDRANTLSGVDIAIDSNGFAHIVYVDSDGAEDDYYARDDGLYATNKSGSFVKTVVANCTGWFSSPEGDRTEMDKPIKIALDSEDNTFIVYKGIHWNKWMGGSDTSYDFEFKSNNNSSLSTNGGSSIIETCSNGTNFYTLISESGQYIVLNGNTKILETAKSFTATAIDMTLDNLGRIYYTAMSGNTILLYQNGAFVEDVQATTAISSHTRFATVVIGNAQYAIYTGTDEDTSLIISRVRYGQTSEFFVPNEIKTWAELQTALNAGGKVKLTQDIIADPGSSYLSIKENSNVTLDLNGYIIDRNRDELEYGGEVIKVEEGATFVINDSRPTATHSPEITYRDLTTNEDVVINGGIITGGNSNGAAGGIYIASSANVTLNAGTIVGNKAKTNSQSGSAGGVDVHMSTFIMNGGAIVGNEAISADSTGLTAGGIYINAPRGNAASFTLNGGTIAGNYSSNTYNNCIAGIYNSGAVFNISGNPKITGNMSGGQKNNVVCSNEYNATVLNVTSALTNGASIGISPWRAIGDNPLTITSGYKTYNNNQDPTKYFTLDTEGVALALDSNKEVKVATEYTVTFLENENGIANADKLKGISGTRVNISYTINDPTVYRYVGWEVVSGGVTISGFSFTFGTSDVVIKLILEEIPLYTLYFEANGGTGTMDSVTQREGTTYVLPECAFTAPAGYEFRDWLVDPIDAIGGFYAPPGNTINVVHNNSITPRWKTIDYTITYDLNGGTVNQANPEGYTVESNNITLVNPTKDNWFFAGWTGTGLTEPTLNVTIPRGSVGNRSYTAVWTKDITSWSRLQEAINNGGTVTLTQDIVADSNNSTLSVSGRVILDLNGYIINGNGYATPVIRVNEYANLILNDSNPNREHTPAFTYKNPITNEDVVVKGGIITGGKDGECGSGIDATRSTLTINAGSIVGNTTTTGDGAGIYLRSGATCTMNGGLIAGNHTTRNGGGVYLGVYSNYTNTFYMKGGSIKHNTADGKGGGVYLWGDQTDNSETFDISGGRIEENKATSGGGGVYLDTRGVLNISGNPVITGNKNGDTNSNVYNTLNVTGPLTDGARIGISTQYVPGAGDYNIFTKGYGTHNYDNPTKYFISDYDNTEVVATENNNGIVEAAVTLNYSVTVTSGENGTASANVTRGISGTQVDLTYEVTDPVNYRFKEWQVISGGITISDNKFTIGTSDVEVKAIFEEIPEYAATFEANGGTGTMDEVVQREGTTYSLPECAFTAPEGYVFKDWLVIPIGESDGVYYNPGAEIIFIHNYLIKPRWTTIEYNIAYNLDGGNSISNPENYTIESENIVLNNPTKDNFVFDGWIGTGLSEPTMQVTIPKGSTGNRTYTAVWATEYNLWIGSTRVKSTNADDVLKDGGSVVYNATTNTLTLNNATINGDGNSERGYGIKYIGNTDLNIIANGNNVVRDNRTRTAASAGLLMGGDIGIYSESTGFTTSEYTANLKITVNKDATLTIAGGDAAGDPYPSSYGICMWQDRGNITIDGEGTLSARMGNSTYCYGIYPAEELIINSTGKVQVYGLNDTYYAIGMWAKKITINSGDIDVFPGHTQFASIAISTEGASYYGEEYGNITINGGTVLAEGGRVPKNNGTNEFDKSKSYGIYADKDITINGCDLVRANTQATEADISIALNKAPILPEEMLAGANTESSDNNMVVYVPENNDTYKFFKVPYTKPQATVVSPIANVLTYNGENQNLIQPGSSTDGIIKYSLDGENFSEDIPQGKEAKDYTIYYKVMGDFNHNDSDVGSIVASIRYTDGLNYIDGTWYNIVNGVLDVTPETLVQYNGNWFYVQKGKLIWGVRTLVQYNGNWFYVNDSTIDWSYTGICEYKGMVFYIQKGTITWSANGLTNVNNTWYYLNNSIVQKDYTGLVQYNGNWFYVQKGELKWGVKTLVQYNGTWFYVNNSMVDWNYTGLAEYKGTWFYIQKGILKWGAKTLVQYNGTWFYVNNSMIDWNYTGLCNYNGKKYYIQKGVLKWGYNGTITYNGVKYNIKNSTVV